MFLGNEIDIDGVAYEVNERGSSISFEVITNLVIDKFQELKFWEKLRDEEFKFVGIAYYEDNLNDPITRIILSDVDVERRMF